MLSPLKFLEKYFYRLWWGLQNLRYASCLLCYLILHFPFWMMTMIIVMQCFSLNKLIFPALLEWLIDNCLCFASCFVSTELWYIFFSLVNFSSYAQSLAISTYIGETLFAVLISILSLVLFAHLIGNMQVLRSLWTIMLVSYLIPFLNVPIAHPLIILYQVQTYLQSITVRFEEWRLKRWDTEEWMRHRQIPQNLRGLVLGDLSSISGLQLEELMKNQSYMPFLQIFVEMSTSPLLGSCSTCKFLFN